jgi:hypothetical protein
MHGGKHKEQRRAVVVGAGMRLDEDHRHLSAGKLVGFAPPVKAATQCCESAVTLTHGRYCLIDTQRLIKLPNSYLYRTDCRVPLLLIEATCQNSECTCSI